MPIHTQRLLHCIRRIASQAGSELSDSQLLARYLSDGDATAFEALVTRHGPMVLRVCQHVLGNRHDAEDAFQATFLVLARKAASIRPTGCLAGWLHGVASRVALGARTTARRRGVTLTPDGAPADPRPDPLAELTARETLCILEEEVQRLPEAYRLPVILCCLHGLTQEEAARQLGWTSGSVKGRLERGRKCLQRRLAGRGLGLAAALALVEVARATAAGPSGKLVASTARAAVAAASGNTAGAGLVSSEVLSLAQSGLPHVALAKGKLGLLLLLAVALATGLAALGLQPSAEPPKPNDQEQPTSAEFPKRNQPRVDLHGDPLPERALARLGTVRMRHGHLITGAVFSGDGKSIIALDFNSGVHVWDVAEGKEVRHFFNHEINGHLALSPDGRTLAVSRKYGPGAGSIRLCDPSTGREVGWLPARDPNGEGVGSLVFSPDGSLLAAGTEEKSVRLWDVATQQLTRTLSLGENVWHIAFSPDGKLLACGTSDGKCRLWDLAQGQEIRQLNSGRTGAHSLFAIFAPKGGPLAVWGYEDRSIRLFDAAGVKEIRRFSVEGTARVKAPTVWGWVNSMCASFSLDGKILAVFRETGGIELWEVESGKQLHALACGRSHKPSFLVFSPDGTKLASAGGDLWNGDNIVRVWDVTQGKEIPSPTGHSAPLSSVAVSPSGDTIATAGQDGLIHLWERSSGKHLFRLDGHPGYQIEDDNGRRPQVSFSSDGQRVIWWGTYDSDGTLRIWDSRIGQVVRRLELKGREASTTRSRNSFWTALSDDGKTALSIEWDKALRFHDLTTGKVIREDPSLFHRPIALSPAGDKMVCTDGTLVTVADHKELFKVGHLGGSNPWVRFRVDGRRLVAAVVAQGPEKLFLNDPPAEEIAVFDVIEGKELRRFGKREGKYYALDAAALSRDGKMVITAGAFGDKRDEQIITLWETETGRERGHFLGHTGRVNSIAISADGKFVVTGAEDTTALVWDATRPQTRNAAIRQAATAADFAACFKDLSGANAEQAYASMWAFINAPKKTVSFLREQSGLFARTDVQAIQRWIRDLDSDEFAKRERASEELGLILDEAEAHLKKALQSKPSVEARRRIDLLLEERKTGFTGRELQRLRVIEILEHIAAPDADATQLAGIALLKKLAAAAEARVKQEAKASLERLEKQK
jgi:RNA polymerase sigma factor (sigma-70 family)